MTKYVTCLDCGYFLPDIDNGAACILGHSVVLDCEDDPAGACIDFMGAEDEFEDEDFYFEEDDYE